VALPRDPVSAPSLAGLVPKRPARGGTKRAVAWGKGGTTERFRCSQGIQ